jgi:hypothetical protein
MCTSFKSPYEFSLNWSKIRYLTNFPDRATISADFGSSFGANVHSLVSFSSTSRFLISSFSCLSLSLSLNLSCTDLLACISDFNYSAIYMLFLLIAGSKGLSVFAVYLRPFFECATCLLGESFRF